MLHTKFRGNQSYGSSEEDFLRVLTIHGNGGHLGYCDQHDINKFSFPFT